MRRWRLKLRPEFFSQVEVVEKRPVHIPCRKSKSLGEATVHSDGVDATVERQLREQWSNGGNGKLGLQPRSGEGAVKFDVNDFDVHAKNEAVLVFCLHCHALRRNVLRGEQGCVFLPTLPTRVDTRRLIYLWMRDILLGRLLANKHVGRDCLIALSLMEGGLSLCALYVALRTTDNDNSAKEIFERGEQDMLATAEAYIDGLKRMKNKGGTIVCPTTWADTFRTISDRTNCGLELFDEKSGCVGILNLLVYLRRLTSVYRELRMYELEGCPVSTRCANEIKRLVTVLDAKIVSIYADETQQSSHKRLLYMRDAVLVHRCLEAMYYLQLRAIIKPKGEGASDDDVIDRDDRRQYIKLAADATTARLRSPTAFENSAYEKNAYDCMRQCKRIFQMELGAARNAGRKAVKNNHRFVQTKLGKVNETIEMLKSWFARIARAVNKSDA